MNYTATATEKQEAMALWQWAMLNPICREYLIHIANERKCDPRFGKELKDQGVRKGVSDYFLPYPRKGYYGLWIELKRRQGGNVQKEQIEWLQKMKGVGFAAYIVHGWEEAKKIIEDYLSEDKTITRKCNG
jgi:hypothetical protein